MQSEDRISLKSGMRSRLNLGGKKIAFYKKTTKQARFSAAREKYMKKKITAIIISAAVLICAVIGIVVVCKSCKHEHEIYAVAAKEGTCTENGNAAYYACRTCDKIFSDEKGENEISRDSVIVTGHKLKEVAGVPATCVDEGTVAYYECSVCGKKFTDEKATETIELSGIRIAPLGHMVEKIAAKEMDCRTLTNGNKEYYVCINDHCEKKFLPCAKSDARAVSLKLSGGEEVCGYEAQDADVFIFVEHDFNADGVCEICGVKKDTASDGLEYFLDTDEKYIVTGRGTCTDKVIFIGGEYNGKEVKGISSAAFYKDTILTGVVILSDKIGYIGENAFRNCTKLKSVSIAGGLNRNGALCGVKSIGENVFAGCSGVTITYDGSKNEWKRIKIAGELNAAVVCRTKVSQVEW